MTLLELINIFPHENWIENRVLLIPPEMMPRLLKQSVHECRLFILVCEGSMEVGHGSSTIEVGSPSLVDMLVWEPVEFVRFSNDLKAWCLLPNYLFTNESLNGLKPADSESFKDRHELPVITVNASELVKLERQFHLLADSLADLNNYYRTELCQTYFRSFLLEAGNIIHCNKASNESPERVENRHDTIVRSFLKLVWRYYKSEHNVDFYAKRLCLSSKHLSRVVNESLGKTAYAVIRDEILQQASELLKTSKLSVQEISSELHFSEMAAFCKFFKRHTGLSPTAFRSGIAANVNNI